MNVSMKRTLSVAVLGLCFMTAAVAAAAERSARASSDVQVLSGGVGEGERKALAEQAHGYNLKLVFTLSTGNYLAEVPFEIQSDGRIVVKHVGQGPWAFAKLAPGTYTVKATYEGRTQTKQVSVDAKGQKRLNFVWPAPSRVKEQPN